MFSYLKFIFVQKKVRDPIFCFTPQVPATERAGPGQDQKPGAEPRSSTWVARTQLLEPPPATPQVVPMQEDRITSRA